MQSDASDTPGRPAPPTPTHTGRVGGGYAFSRSDRLTDALAAAAAYDTYRTLPCNAGAHTATDIAILAEILKTAEAELDAAGHSTAQQATLSQVLRAYQRVLQSAGLDPEADTRYYRTLLRLSLDKDEPDWFGRLFREIASNTRRHDVLPEQQQMLFNVLLRCRVGGSPGKENLAEAAAEWAQDVVQGSRPASAGAGALGSEDAAIYWGPGVAIQHPTDKQQQQQPSSSPCHAPGPSPAPPAFDAAVWDQLEAASFASLPLDTGAEVDQAHQLEHAVHAWQLASAGAAIAAPLVVAAQAVPVLPGLAAHQRDQRAQPGQQASASTNPNQCHHEHAEAGSKVLVEDALCSWPLAPEGRKPVVGHQVHFAVPPPLAQVQHQKQQQTAWQPPLSQPPAGAAQPAVSKPVPCFVCFPKKIPTHLGRGWSKQQSRPSPSPSHARARRHGSAAHNA